MQPWNLLGPMNPDYPEWVEPVSYNTGDKVLYLSQDSWTWAVYESLIDNNFAVPTDTESWQKTTDNPNSVVKDDMIEEAFLEAKTILPDDGISDPNEYKTIFLLLAAHFLITDWQASNAGMNANGSSGIILSRRVADFSATYALNPILTQYPQYALLATTYWGQKALLLLSRHWVGNVVSVGGAFTDY